MKGQDNTGSRENNATIRIRKSVYVGAYSGVDKNPGCPRQDCFQAIHFYPSRIQQPDKERKKKSLLVPDFCKAIFILAVYLNKMYFA